MRKNNLKTEYLNKRIAPDESYEDLLEFPKYLEVETVNACNARCPMCTINDWERNIPLMQDDVFLKILSDIKPHVKTLKRVSLYRDGEPLIDKKLGSRIRELKRIGVKEVSIATNAALLDDQKALELLDAGLDIIVISFDSLNKTIYEDIRVRLNFEEVLKNILGFIALREKIGAKTSIWMRMIRQESNQHEWDQYEKFWAPILKKSDRIYYHNIFNWGGQLVNFKGISENTEIDKPCVALWSLMVIFTDGKVPLCNVDFNNKYPSGDILHSSIQDIWKSKLMNERRRLHLNGNKAEISLCDGCNVWEEHKVSGNNSKLIGV
jgi:MoaA/NifB/PqqE/SkfB family radical SAM enzyme